MQPKLLFEFLQIAVDRRSAFTRVPTPEEWGELYRFCQTNGLLGMGCKAIERLPKAQRPGPIEVLRWGGWLEKLQADNEKADRLCAKVCRILEKHQLHATILKGQSLAKLYDYPEVRATGDIDVWVVPVGFEKASLAERRKRTIELLYRYFTPSQLQSVVYHHMEFTKIEDTSVELHFTPSWMFNPVYNRRLQRWFLEEGFRRVQKGSEGREGFQEVSGFRFEEVSEGKDSFIEFQKVFVLLHIFRHLFAEGANLKQLTDYYFVLKCDQNRDRRELITYCKNYNKCDQFSPVPILITFAGAVEYVLQQIYDMPDEWLIAPVDEKAGKVLLADVLSYNKERVLQDGTWKKFFVYLGRSLKYLRFYPEEVLWMPVFKIYQFFWRKTRRFEK